MPPCIEDVRHDAAALHRFIDSIASGCKVAEGYPSYAESSTAFFNYISSLAEKTKAYLKQFVDNLDPKLAVDDPQDFYDRTQIIRNLRINWFELHELVKPALEADTLHVPYPLVNALISRLRMIKRFEGVRFTVLHTNYLNYFQIGARSMRELAAEIARIVPHAPSFPKKLGIIAHPYSQSSSIFLNFALAHEMGHFVFQEGGKASKIRPTIAKALKKSLKTLKASAPGLKLGRRDPVWCRDQVLKWCEEIYCDLFALWLIGPCFSFSFIELFALSRLASGTGRTGAAPPISSLASFKDSHPATAFRIGEHVRFLKSKELGWWDKIDVNAKDGPKNRTNHYLTLMAEAEALPLSTFTFRSQFKPDLSDVVIDTFFMAVREVSRVVKDTFLGVPTEISSFDGQPSERTMIEKYLSFGVVPSRLVFPNGTIKSPNIVALLNAANFFYIERLDLLINQIDDGRPDCLECRAFWAERVEMWTSKALEDIAR